MELERAIKQKRPFATEIERAMVNLMYTQSYLNNLIAEFFDKYDLTIKQYNILRILNGANEPISTAEIRDRMIDRMSDTSRIVDRLERKNLVVKGSCPADKRKVDVVISDKGKQLIEQVGIPLRDWHNDSIHLNEEEAGSLNALLDKLRNGK